MIVKLWRMGKRGHSSLIAQVERVRDVKPLLTEELLEGCVYVQIIKNGKFRYPWLNLSGTVYVFPGDMRKQLRAILRS